MHQRSGRGGRGEGCRCAGAQMAKIAMGLEFVEEKSHGSLHHLGRIICSPSFFHQPTTRFDLSQPSK